MKGLNCNTLRREIPQGNKRTISNVARLFLLMTSKLYAADAAESAEAVALESAPVLLLKATAYVCHKGAV
ncbi:hypothetical protein PRIPAC_88581 [Pristionchus pacificus]|uniref:Uncharacterized protein n=1 Tax=Pristionchus pacificus TaxID=54126 RepID=A0A2A6B401_PRIPA|nr:hypothetical protein PRIPAC_88581 [Pristionchus pacificus]|eukprot:PDM60615.1 hypothetical protein PRIPAC_53593 [Pristionchus pacificus]